MSTSLERNDELYRLWQRLEPPSSDKEVRGIMELVERRKREFERIIYWRNVREYAACIIVAVTFAVFAWNARTPLQQIGHSIVSLSALWITGFLWLMQRSRQAPLPESSGKAYEEALLVKYERQILLTRTAWAWYVLPLTIGLLISSLGADHATVLGLAMTGFMLAAGAGIALLNWKASAKLAAEKRELEQLLGRAK